MGSATLFHLARRGLRVLGLERFDLVHEYGSSATTTMIASPAPVRLAPRPPPGGDQNVSLTPRPTASPPPSAGLPAVSN